MGNAAFSKSPAAVTRIDPISSTPGQVREIPAYFRKPMTSETARLDAALAVLRPLGPAPDLGIVLGSGLGSLVDRVEGATRVPYGDLPHMPLPSVVGHGGELVVGTLAGRRVALLSGRAHLYEGHEPARTVFGARLLARWGVPKVLLTNAAGGLAEGLRPGSLLLIADHLNLTGQNPLRGPNEEELGPRFPDMTDAYCPRLRALAKSVAAEVGIELPEGVYAGLLGPTYETPAEIRMLRTLGASAVGMSTVLETIALRHMGVRVLGLSCVTNLAAGLGTEKLSHEEVAREARRARSSFETLILGVCARLSEA